MIRSPKIVIFAIRICKKDSFSFSLPTTFATIILTKLRTQYVKHLYWNDRKTRKEENIMFQNIQRKRALCKLISATFMANTIGLPMSSAVYASTTDSEETAPTTIAKNAVVSVDESASAVADKKTNSSSSTTKENSTSSTTKNNSSLKDPTWAFQADGTTPKTKEELKTQNYKDYYTNDQVNEIYNYIKWYGYDWVVDKGFNVSKAKRASDGSTYIVIPHEKVQTNMTSSSSSTAGANTQTAVTCGDGYESVGGTCVVKCKAYEERDDSTGACKVKTCDNGKTLNQETGVCENTVCPTNTTYVEGYGCKIAPENEATSTTENTACPTGYEMSQSADAGAKSGKALSCVKECPEGTTRDADGICKAATTEISSVCELKYQVWSDKDKKCETKVCATGETLDKESGNCVPTVKCPIGQTMNANKVCVANDCTKENKDTWTKSDGTQVCVDKCNENKNEVRNKTTGTCDVLSNKTVKSCPSNAIKDTEKGTCEVCPSGQKPNDDQTACVSTSSSSSSGSKDSILSKLGGLVGIASVFLNKGTKENDDPLVKNDEWGKNPSDTKMKGSIQQPTGKKNYGVISNVDIKASFFTKDGKPTETILVNEPAYLAEFDFDLSKNFAGENDLKFVKGVYSVSSSSEVSPSFSTSKQAFTKAGEKVKLYPTTTAPSTSGHYYLYVLLQYQNQKTGTIYYANKRIPFLVFDQANTLASSNDKKFLSEGAKDIKIEASDYSYSLTGTKIIAAKWNTGGYCELTVSGGNVVGEGTSDTLGEGIRVGTTRVSQQQCEEKDPDKSLVGKSANFESLTVNGDTLMDDANSEGNIEGVSRSWDDKSDAEKQANLDSFHQLSQMAEENAVTYASNKDFPFGQDKDGNWTDYTGHKLSAEDITKYGLDSVKMQKNEDGTYTAVKEDGSEVNLSDEDAAKAKLAANHDSLWNGTYRDFGMWLKQKAGATPIVKDSKIVEGTLNTLFPGTYTEEELKSLEKTSKVKTSKQVLKAVKDVVQDASEGGAPKVAQENK